LADGASRTILATGICFALVVAGLVALWAWSSREETLDRAVAVTEGFSLTYKSFTEQVVERISSTAADIAAARVEVLDNGDRNHLLTLMRRRIEANPLLQDILVIDAKGWVVEWTRPGAVPPDTLFAEANAVLPLRDSPKGAVTPLFRSTMDGGRWVFAVSQPVRGSDGVFAGAAVAIVDQKRFADAFGAILESQSASVALAHADGMLMVRVPELGIRIGEPMVAIAERRGVVVERRSGVTTSRLDGLRRVFSERRVDNYPLIIFVTVTEADALSAWNRSFVMVGLLALLVLVADWVVTVQLLGMLTRRREVEARTRQQNTLLAAQRETSPDGILITDQDSRVVSWNQRFLDIWRIPLALAGHGDSRELHRVMETMVEQVDAFREAVDRRVEDPDLGDEGTEILLRDGRVLERFSRALNDDGNGHWGRVWFYRDVTGRKRAEDALRRSERRHRAIFESVGDGLFVLDESGRIVDGNQAAFLLHGETADAMVGESLVNWLEVGTGPAFLAYLRSALGGERRYLETRHYLAARGHRFLAETRAVPFEYGGRTRLLATVRDITDRRAAEDALRLSEQRFRDVTDSVGEMIYEVDGGFTITFITGRAPDQLGMSPVDVVGRSLFSLMHPDDRDRVEPLVRSLAARAVRFSDIAFRVPLPEGGHSWQLLSGIPVLGPHGQLRGYRGACMDITQSRRREVALRQANDKLEAQTREMSDLARSLEASRAEILKVQERFDLAVRGANDGVWDWDVAGNRLYLSPRSKEMLGYEDDEIGEDPQQWIDLVHPSDLALTQRTVNEHLQGQSEYYRMVVRFRHKAGHYVWVLDRGMAQRNARGGAVRMVGTHSDITEMRRYEEALRAAKVEAETANRAKSQFLAVMSHEIRTPMTGILGMGDLLLSSRLDGDQERYARTLMRSARTLLALLDDVLDFSKIEAGQLEMETVSFHPAELVDDVVGLFSAKGSEKGLVLSGDGAIDRDLVVRGDPTRLRQVLFNLVGNAIKFTEKGSVTVAMTAVRAGDDAVDLSLSIADTGLGMDDAQLSRLFSPFTQADASTTRRFGGTGLGLTICKRLVEMMGGDIVVESALGRGSTFTVRVTLPLGDANDVISLDRLAAPWLLGDAVETDTRPLRVLLAEDNETNMLLIATVLRKAGHTVDTAANGAEAVARAEAVGRGEVEPFDLVLMDMQMPEMDGAEATRRIRAMDGPVATLPIVALTADVRLEDRDRYLSSGLTDLLTKPVDWGRLHDVITRVTGTGDGVETGEARALSSRAADKGPLTLPGPNWKAAPDFDGAVLDVLTEQVGRGKVRPLIQSAMDNLDRHLTKVDALARDGSAEDLRRAAHAFKGMAGQFGATRARLLSMVIEDKAGDPVALAPLLAALGETVAKARRSLEARLHG
jgi:PAS domain S-box-containing protein